MRPMTAFGGTFAVRWRLMTARGIGALCPKPNEAIDDAHAVGESMQMNVPIGHGSRQFIVRIDSRDSSV